MRRALGKGLSQLLSEQSEAAPTSVSVGSIRPNKRQPRKSFDEEALQELADSIKEYGVIQPIVVRPVGDDKYELIAGERRLRAAKAAGLAEVPVSVRSASAQTSLEIALIENVQREDISPMECAYAYKRLQQEFSLKQEDVAKKVSKSRVAISNTLRLLQLPEEVQDALHEGVVSEGHARALLMVSGPQRQITLFDKIIGDGLTVRQAEQAARGMESAKPGGSSGKSKQKKKKADPNLQALEQGLSEHLGSPVTIKKSGKGGELVVEFFNDEDLQRILELIRFQL
jgi:ParB family chromosome partitioning protein